MLQHPGLCIGLNGCSLKTGGKVDRARSLQGAGQGWGPGTGLMLAGLSQVHHSLLGRSDFDHLCLASTACMLPYPVCSCTCCPPAATPPSLPNTCPPAALCAEENLAVAAAVPPERLVLETDSPWCEIRPSHAGGWLAGCSWGVRGRMSHYSGLTACSRCHRCPVLTLVHLPIMPCPAEMTPLPTPMLRFILPLYVCPLRFILPQAASMWGHGLRPGTARSMCPGAW